MEEEFYASIKLVSGEEIFSLVSVDDQEDKTMLILNNPVTIDIITLLFYKGIQGYKIDPWLRFVMMIVFS